MNVNTPQRKGGFSLPGMKQPTVQSSQDSADLHRAPLFGILPNAIRNHFIAMCGEFTGTFLFLFFAFSGTQAANTKAPGGPTGAVPDTSQLLYISLCFGFSLAVNAWVFFRISGGLFNPAVTLGMCLVGAVSWARGVFIFISQLLGAITAAGVVDGLFPGALNVRTSLGGGTTVVQGLFIEMFLTAQLVFTIFMLAAEKTKATFIAPVGIGLSLFISELAAVYYTGGSVNPARSFGPSVVLHSFHDYHWIYWVGPILGSILAAGFYKFMKVLEYETANPDQDLDQTAPVAAFVPEYPEPDSENPRVSFAPDEYQNRDKSHGDAPSGDETAPSSSTRRPLSGVSSRPLSGSSSLGRLVIESSPSRRSPVDQVANGRPRSNSSLPRGPHLPVLKGGRKGPTYPPTEGAANYPNMAEDRVISFDVSPAAEAGEYEHRRAGRT